MDQADSYKVLVMGDISVGKTSLLVRIAFGTFSEKPEPTIIDFRPVFVDRDGKQVKINLWDTGGQERFGTVTSSFYRSADGAILVYDINNKDSLANIRCWTEEVDRYSRSNVCKIVVGAKSDLSCPTSITPAEAESVARAAGAKSFQVSSLTGENVQLAFQSLVSDLLQSSSSSSSSSHGNSAPFSIALHSGSGSESGSGRCC